MKLDSNMIKISFKKISNGSLLWPPIRVDSSLIKLNKNENLIKIGYKSLSLEDINSSILSKNDGNFICLTLSTDKVCIEIENENNNSFLNDIQSQMQGLSLMKSPSNIKTNIINFENNI